MFKQILLPIDFSDLTSSVLKAGQYLAMKFGAHLKMVHVFHPQYQKGRLRTMKGIGQLKSYYEQKLCSLKDANYAPSCVSNGITQKIDAYAAVKGFADEEILKLTRNQEVELIIMGVNSRDNIYDKTFGKIATEVSIDAPCSVLLIPPGIQEKPVRNILFLTDHEELTQALVDRISGMAYLFDAAIHFFHIEYGKAAGASKKSAVIEFDLLENYSHTQCNVTSVPESNLLDQVNHYLKHKDIDLVNILAENRSLWADLLKQKMDGSYGLARNVPLMISYL